MCSSDLFAPNPPPPNRAAPDQKPAHACARITPTHPVHGYARPSPESPTKSANTWFWYELMTTDPKAATAFYTALLGWKA